MMGIGNTYRSAAVACMGAMAVGLVGTGMAFADAEVRWMHIETDRPEVALWEEIVADFEAANPNIAIDMQFLENEAFKARLPTLLQSNAAPHTFYSWGGGVLRAQSQTGTLMPLSDVLEQADWEGAFNAAAVGGLSFDNEVWAVPFKMETLSFFYNKEMFEEAGIDAGTLTDWEAFLGAVEDLKQAGFTPIAVGGGDAWPVHFYWSYLAMRIGGRDVVDAAKTNEGEGFLHPAFIEAGEQLARLGEMEPFQPGYLGANWPETMGAFADGRAAILLGFPNAATAQASAAADGVGLDLDNVGRFPFPDVAGGDGLVTDTLGGLNGWAVFRDAPAETIAFLQTFVSPENQCRMARAGLIIPVVQGQSDCVQAGLMLESAQQLAESTWHQNYFDQDFGPALGRVINDISVAVVSGRMSPEDSVRMLQNEADLQ